MVHVIQGSGHTSLWSTEVVQGCLTDWEVQKLAVAGEMARTGGRPHPHYKQESKDWVCIACIGQVHVRSYLKKNCTMKLKKKANNQKLYLITSFS